MPTYNVSVQSQNYNIVSEAKKKFAVGVNYDIPAKYLQNNNEVLDDFTAQFDGTRTEFDLTEGGTPYFPTNEGQLIVSINGLLQHPGVDYTVSGSKIIFPTPPSAGDKLFTVAQSTTADLTSTINVVYGSGSVDMNTGEKGELQIDVNGRIKSWTLTSDVVGILIMDVQKCKFNDFPNFKTICVGDKPQINGTLKSSGDNLSSRDKDVIAGDMPRFRVDQVNKIRRFMLILKVFL